MKLVVRVDDFGWTDREWRVPVKHRDIGLCLARRFHSALGGVPYLAAVIPSALDSGGMDWLASRPAGLTVAAHGYNHVPGTGGVHSEMHGLQYEQMRHALSLVRHVLGPTPHFVPPFNALESQQPEALWHEGFRYVWGAPSEWPTPPEPRTIYRDLMLVPAWLPLYGASVFRMSADARPLVDVLPRVMQLPGAAVLTLHLPWEFSRDPELTGLRQLVAMIRDSVITAEQYLRGPAAWA